MKKGIPWQDRAWTPVEGMKIRYRAGVNLKSKMHPDAIATIVSVFSDSTLYIEKDRGVVKKVRLAKNTWMTNWEPVPSTTDESVHAEMRFLSEDDVRRMVREELASRAGKVESALRSFLDELFDVA